MTATLDVAVGLVFVYLVLSLLASAVAEGIEHFYRYRADYLRQGIEKLLLAGNQELRARLYDHPLIKSLYTQSWWEGQNKLTRKLLRAGGPAYIPTRQFVMAFLDIVARPRQGGTVTPGTSNEVAQLLEALTRGEQDPKQTSEKNKAQNKEIPPAVADALRALIADAGNDIEKVKANVGEWFDGSMDRVAGWYKRRAQFVLLLIGIGIAIGINADTLTIVQTLSNDSAVRAAVVAAAESRAREPLTPSAPPDPSTTAPLPARAVVTGIQSEVNAVVSELDALGLPIGWRQYDPSRDARTNLIEQRVWPRWSGEDWGAWAKAWWDQFASHLLGWLLTALAISFGAPFWFDLLNKIMVIRSTVKPREKSREEGSEDRQVAGGQGQTVRLEIASVK
jgi:hypothetical protein